MNDIKFLLKELFTTHTREGELPLTVEDYEMCYSQREYEAILLQVLQSLDIVEEK